MPVESLPAVAGVRSSRVLMNKARACLQRLAALAITSLVLTGCQSFGAATTPPPQPTQKTFSSGITGYNFTDEGVQRYFVDDNYGSNLRPYGGGGSTSCCMRLPTQWHPELAVTVQWTIGHWTTPYATRKHLSVREQTECCWTQRTLSKTVPIERYEEGGRLQVFFLPDDEIKVYVSDMLLGHEDHPSGMAYPKRPADKPHRHAPTNTRPQ